MLIKQTVKIGSFRLEENNGKLMTLKVYDEIMIDHP